MNINHININHYITTKTFLNNYTFKNIKTLRQLHNSYIKIIKNPLTFKLFCSYAQGCGVYRVSIRRGVVVASYYRYDPGRDVLKFNLTNMIKCETCGGKGVVAIKASLTD